MTTDIYKAPEADLNNDDIKVEGLPYYVVSIRKLVILYILTMGVYGLYWFYKNWQRQDITHHLNIWPAVRAIFTIIFVYPLFSTIEDDLKIKRPDMDLSYQLLAIVFIVTSLLNAFVSNVFEALPNAGLISLILVAVGAVFQSYILMRVQKAINIICDDEHGQTNNRYGIGVIFLCLIGLFFWGIIMLAAFLPNPV